MKHKINKKMLLNEKGFSWHIRYSENEETDKHGRWARICYYNGIQIAWISGFVKTRDMPKLDNRRCGICNYFVTSLQFPISSQGIQVGERFDNFEDAKKYAEEIFMDFIKIMNK